MPTIILLNKPFNCLSQFSRSEEKTTLANIFTGKKSIASDFYPAGRLDHDSEGLLLLTNSGDLQHRITSPDKKLPKTYWVQVEGKPNQAAIDALITGVTLKDGKTKPAKVRTIIEPLLWARTPPIRQRKEIPTHWLEIIITEGRNRQVRRMTAAVNLPTLRLIRAAIGPWTLGELQPGECRMEEVHLPKQPVTAKKTRNHVNSRNTPARNTRKR